MSGPIAMDGPLSSYAAGFHAELLAKGYCGRTAGRQVMLFGQLSGWMQTTGLAAHALTPQQVAAFLDFLTPEAYRQQWTHQQSATQPTLS